MRLVIRPLCDSIATALYAQVATEILREVVSPLENLRPA